VSDIETFEIKHSRSDRTIAIGWYMKSEFLGTIIDENQGLRFRKFNLQVGDRFLLNAFSKEERFNGWVQGEIYVFDDNLIPNARRDDFEKK